MSSQMILQMSALGTSGMILIIMSPAITALFVRRKVWLPAVALFWFIVSANIFLSRTAIASMDNYFVGSVLCDNTNYVSEDLQSRLVIKRNDDKSLVVHALPIFYTQQNTNLKPIVVPIPNFVRMRLGAAAWPALVMIYVTTMWLVLLEVDAVIKARRTKG